MPDPITLGGLAAANSGSLINAATAMLQNIGQRRFLKKQYEQQKKDSITFWNMQNEYNHPLQQMTRLQEAGLNPNLVYGKGADVLSSPIKGPTMGNFNQQPVRVEGDFLGKYYDVQAKSATVENMKKQNDLLTTQQAKMAAEISSIIQGTAKSKFDLELAQSLRNNTVQFAEANLRKMNAEIDVMLNRNEREAASNAQSIKESVQRVIKMKAETGNINIDGRRLEAMIKNLEQDTRIKQADANMKAMGINPNDPAWLRAVGQLVSQILGNDPVNAIKDWWKSVDFKPW